MKKVILLYLILVATQISFAQQSFQWANIFKDASPGLGYAESYAATIDSQGNVICTGRFNSVIDFDPGPGTFTIDAGFGWDIFVCKLDNNGNFLWAKSFDGSQACCGQGIVSDPAGNLYISGYYYQTVDFDPGPATFTLNSGNNDVFISKLDPNGNFVWAKSIGGNLNEQINKIILDAGGNIFLCGFFNGTCDFDPTSTSLSKISAGASDAFICKFDANCNIVWANTFGGPQDDQATSFAVDNSGNIYVTGYYRATADMDPGAGLDNHVSLGVEDVYFSRFDAAGNLIWCRTMGSPGPDFGIAIHPDNLGNVYLGGCYQDSCDFDLGPGTLWVNSTNGGQGFLIKIDQNANYVWHQVIYSMGSYVREILEDSNGDIITFGIFTSSADFDSGPGVALLNSTDGSNYFYKLNPSGNFLLAKNYGTPIASNCQTYGAVLDSYNSIFATGLFYYTSDFDPSPTTTYTISGVPGNNKAFIGKIWGICVTPTTSPSNISSSNNMSICNGGSAVLQVTTVASYVRWYNSATSTVSVGAGTVFVTPALSTGTYTYYAADFTCGAGPRIPIVVNVAACTNIKEKSKTLGITIFPNPVDDELSVNLNGAGKCELKIYNTLGQLVLKKNLESDIEKINVSQLNKGIYLLEVRKDADMLYSNHFIKK